MTASDPTRPVDTTNDSVHFGRFQELIPPIWEARRPIAFFTLTFTLLTVVINYFILPPQYTAVATLLPETERSRVTALSQVADIAEFAGVSIPGNEIAQLYPAIVTSDAVLGQVIEKEFQTRKSSSPLTLEQVFEYDDEDSAVAFEETIKSLRDAIAASFDHQTNIVTVTARMMEPQLAADVLNAVIDELDKFMREKRSTNATEERKWIETRLKEVGTQLRNSEEVLKSFKERNRRTADSPDLVIQEQRLRRDVEINSAVFLELKKHHELARIEEIKNSTIVNILDRARPPVKKSGPARAANTLLIFLLAAIVSSSYYVFRERNSEKISLLKSLFQRKSGPEMKSSMDA